jgi:hypothetical protein
VNDDERRKRADDLLDSAKGSAARTVKVVRSAESPVEAAPEPPKRPPVPLPEARANLARALNELDDRLSVKRSIERHPVAWAVGGGVAILAIAGALVWALRSKD